MSSLRYSAKDFVSHNNIQGGLDNFFKYLESEVKIVRFVEHPWVSFKDPNTVYVSQIMSPFGQFHVIGAPGSMTTEWAGKLINELRERGVQVIVELEPRRVDGTR